jgi:hypothetical protein
MVEKVVLPGDDSGEYKKAFEVAEYQTPEDRVSSAKRTERRQCVPFPFSAPGGR